MKLIVGLGNPGEGYENNRHNSGYRLVQRLWETGRSSLIPSHTTDTYMNDSGRAVKKLVDRYSLDLKDLYVAHDDLDLPLGTYKIQFGVGPKIHNGVSSVEEALGTKDFWRIRIGIDNREPDNRIPGEQYVLEDFTDEERIILDSVIKEVCKKLETS